MENVRFETQGKKKLAGILHPSTGTPRAGLIIMHGLYASKDQRWMQELGEQVSKKLGIEALRFDFFGNGESEGDFKDCTYDQLVADARAAIAFLRARGIKKIFVLGHSMGGGVALIVAGKENVDGVITLAPVTKPPNVIKRIARRVQDRIFVEMGGGLVELPRAYVDSSQNFSPTTFIDQLTMPMCLIHGKADPILLSKDSEFLFSKLPAQDKELHLLSGADHVFSSHWHEVFDIVLSWLQRHVE
jgi:esterase/lipase